MGKHTSMDDYLVIFLEGAIIKGIPDLTLIHFNVRFGKWMQRGKLDCSTENLECNSSLLKNLKQGTRGNWAFLHFYITIFQSKRSPLDF